MKEPERLNEEELRRSIRQEIQQRDREKKILQRKREEHKITVAQAERKREIYLEELKNYYKGKPGYREVIGEDGEIDYIPEEEVDESARLYDVELEDPGIGRRKQKIFIISAFFLAIMSLVVLYFILSAGTGTIQVTCNLAEARIILDANPTEYYTDTIIEEVPAGEHLITVEKAGFKIQGEMIQEIELRKGANVAVSFFLVPDLQVQSGTSSGEGNK